MTIFNKILRYIRYNIQYKKCTQFRHNPIIIAIIKCIFRNTGSNNQTQLRLRHVAESPPLPFVINCASYSRRHRVKCHSLAHLVPSQSIQFLEFLGVRSGNAGLDLLPCAFTVRDPTLSRSGTPYPAYRESSVCESGCRIIPAPLAPACAFYFYDYYYAFGCAKRRCGSTKTHPRRASLALAPGTHAQQTGNGLCLLRLCNASSSPPSLLSPPHDDGTQTNRLFHSAAATRTSVLSSVVCLRRPSWIAPAERARILS